jgi:hypothetical protein
MQTNAKTRIRLDAIEQAHRALDALPEHRPEELTKTQAVHRLIAPIRATQSKGYSLAAIGKVLSECGIPITTGALRAYISEARAAGKKRKRRSAKPAVQRPQGTQVPTPKSKHSASTAQVTTGAPKPDGVGAARSIDLDWEPATRSDKAAAASGPRASFPVRPDTKDI